MNKYTTKTQENQYQQRKIMSAHQKKVETAKITRDMTQGNPYGHMVAFAMPVLLSQIFQQLYNTADTFIVGKFLGTDALAAVSSSGTLIFFIDKLFYGNLHGRGCRYIPLFRRA